MRFFPLLLWLACALTFGTCAQAGDSAEPMIWSGLVLATNEVHPKQSPPKLQQFEAKMDDVFGYNQFVLVGEQARRMRDPMEHWLVPSKEFFLYVDTQGGDAMTAYQLKLELYQKKHRLAEFETKLGEDSPLFIRGPLYAGGQLIIVLLVEEPAR